MSQAKVGKSEQAVAPQQAASPHVTTLDNRLTPAPVQRGVAVPTASKKSKSAKSSSKKSKRNPRPPRAVRLSQAEHRMQPRYNSRSDRIGVSVTLNLPRIKGITGMSRPKVTPKLLARVPFLAKIFTRVAAASERLPIPVRLRRPALAVVALAVVFFVIFSVRDSHTASDPATGKVAAAAVRTKPDFKPLVPSAAEASSTTYDGKRNLVTYDTTFSGARLTVSQQPLPLRFAHDANALQAAADSLTAKQRLDTAKGPLYIATNQQGDQLAIFAGPQVLLFIHSDRKLDDASWKSFIELLAVKT